VQIVNKPKVIQKIVNGCENFELKLFLEVN
jgi:hypothetical protein